METFISVADIGRNGRTFAALSEEANPCVGCSAPCCRVLLAPHPTPTTFSDLDYIRYALGFPATEMVVHRDGSWQMLSHRACTLLDGETSLCTVHGTSRKPKVCAFFNPYRCWYKRNFTTDDPPDIVRLDSARFELLLEAVSFDDEERIEAIPSWEALHAIVHGAAPPD